MAPTRRSLLVDGDWRLSSVELNHLTACVAGGLRAAGVRRRDAVAWQLPNCWQAVVLYRACWRLGAVATPVHNHAGPADVEAVLGQV
ncbi:MAG: AMP-binding protein, partial [Actinomycetota bacterium]|nr:AMP-binding protein [Actinomycetota bacterium]